MNVLLATLEKDNSHLRSVMLNAIRNVRPTHLLDPEVTEAWAKRPAHIPPKQLAVSTTQHAGAEPVMSSAAQPAPSGKHRLPLAE